MGLTISGAYSRWARIWTNNREECTTGNLTQGHREGTTKQKLF